MSKGQYARIHDQAQEGGICEGGDACTAEAWKPDESCLTSPHLALDSRNVCKPGRVPTVSLIHWPRAETFQSSGRQGEI